MEDKLTIRNWLSLIGLTCSAFIFNTSEFIPIGLLTDIARDFAVTDTKAGMLISVYAFAVMILSLPLMILVSRFELKKLISFVILVFAVFQISSAMSTSYIMLMISRIGVACSHAIFWSIVSPLAVRTVPNQFKNVALSMIATGTSIAMIFGLPIGRIIGLQIGWRMTFLYIGIFAFALIVYLLAVLPIVPSRGNFSLHKLPMLVKRPALSHLFVLSFAFATSYYTGYSYIEPFLKQIASMPNSWITVTLMIFGGMGILGSLCFSKFYSANPFRFMSIAPLSLCGCLTLLHVSSFHSVTIILLCALWGMTFTASNITLQADTINYSPLDATAVSTSIFSGLTNLGIACGTYIGGAVYTHLSLSVIGYAGGILALLTYFYWIKRVIPAMKDEQSAVQ